MNRLSRSTPAACNRSSSRPKVSRASCTRASSPDRLLPITPGIRRTTDAIGDQHRVTGPAEAVAAGADYVVVGRPIRDAADPAAAARRILDEIALASG